MIGNCCHKHFEEARTTTLSYDERKMIHDACTDCMAFDRAQRDKWQREGTIDPSQPIGVHIALTCKNHPDLRWHTKNIDFIGARSIFFAGNGTECSCPGRDLILLAAKKDRQDLYREHEELHSQIAAATRIP